MPEWNIEHWQLAVSAATLGGIITLVVAVLYGMSHPRKPAQDGGSESPGWAERLGREPIRVRTAIVAVFAVGGSFGLPVTETQQGVIVIAVLAVLALLSETTRSKVTPVEHPNMEAIEKAG